MSRTMDRAKGNTALASATVKCFFSMGDFLVRMRTPMFCGDRSPRPSNGSVLGGRNRLGRRRRVRRLGPDRLGLQFGRRHGRGIQRRLTPGDFNRQLRKVDNAAIATVTALIVS